ncbi:hypothetical protein [Eubacterium ventriosum]|uniref:hypothetical protein n=1 Tax=Eubacterium ventriosum TaxID=39496 RepID=UPI0021FD0DF4|nr:MAG: MatP C-terminal ribbon-helix-helix domain [Bacteriophage sp.]
MSEPNTQFDEIIKANEKKKENAFGRSRSNTVGSKDRPQNTPQEEKPTEPEKEYVPERPHIEPQEEKPKSKKKVTVETKSDNAILNELFPESNKAEDFKTHSVYLKDSHWKKIQKIAKEQNISNSAVLTKILDKVL